MRKRIFSIFLAVAMLFCLIPLSVHAEHQHTFENKHGYDLTNLPEGYSIPCKIYESPCSDECGYSLYSWDVFGLSGQFVDKSGTSGLVVYQHYRDWFENIYGKNATAKKYETGGGSAGTGGVGRRPSGYADDNGTPTVGPTGVYTITVNPTIEIVDNEHCTVTITGNKVRFADFDDTYFASNYTHPIRVYYTTTAPADGKFSVPYTLKQLTCSYSGSVRSGSVYLDGSSTNYLSLIKLKNGTDFSGGTQLLSMEGTGKFSQGSKVFFVYAFSSYKGLYPQFSKSFTSTDYQNYTFYPVTLTFTPSESTKQTDITINQNVWNGNIYVDDSTNLTYIYPQYTTVNENNETVTNISENPIIYDSTTNQYYTYDSVTNNYYYITYVETPTPTPSPDPTPTPDPGTDPTPTPRPSTPESGESGGSSGSSWWDKLLNKIGDAIIDGLLGAISAVLKLIFKLFTTILGWIIWLASQVLTLFPFLPPGLGALLIGGVVVCFIIGLIKFIRG